MLADSSRAIWLFGAQQRVWYFLHIWR